MIFFLKKIIILLAIISAVVLIINKKEEYIVIPQEAIRIRIYQNGEYKTYAKKNSIADEPEEGTIEFKKIDNSEGTIILEERKDFTPGTLDKYTIVIWLEGDDPDCTDPLIGGEIKMHMNITEEHIEQK